MTAIAAVDTALWDIRGKTLNAPVYELLGGASRESVLVYGHANGTDIDGTAAAVAEYLGLGYRAIRAQSGIPGLATAYGVAPESAAGNMRHTPDTDLVFPHHYQFESGTMHPGAAPGLGVDIDEVLAAEYPYEPAYLPTNRKLDGTVHSW